MPPAKPPSPPQPPAPVSEEEERFILDVVRRCYGDDAVVRNSGPDPKRLNLHVETDRENDLPRHECLGYLLCDIDRDHIDLDVTRRGERIRGNAKVAYRQGVVLRGQW